MKIAWQNCSSLNDANLVLFGVSSSDASLYKGSEKAPQAVREASHKYYSGATLSAERFVLLPESGVIKKGLYDFGDISKGEIVEFVSRMVSLCKVPIMIGGDHGCTFNVLKALNSLHKRFSLIYFDAHLDMVSGEGHFYGSVLSDASRLKYLKLNKSACIGFRAFREEELKNARKNRLLLVPASRLEELSIARIFSMIKRRVYKNVYMSIDIDVIDPAFAPGVSDPVACGITPLQLCSLAKRFARLKLMGCDIVEVNPKRDKNDTTASLAAKLLAEIAASIK
ncbi:MAG: arginase family protein [Candidatus Diapherotrites archaeon]|nr:arginase family protein [Candidatus Diapherotrites archaeon]